MIRMAKMLLLCHHQHYEHHRRKRSTRKREGPVRAVKVVLVGEEYSGKSR